MKIIKLLKTDYTDLARFLTRIGLVNENHAYPERVFVNRFTFNKMKKAHRSLLRKKHKNITKHQIDYAIALEFLNLGPAVLEKKNGGNLLADDHAIVILKT